MEFDHLEGFPRCPIRGGRSNNHHGFLTTFHKSWDDPPSWVKPSTSLICSNYSDRKHEFSPQMVVFYKGNPRLFQGNLGEGEISFQFGQIDAELRIFQACVLCLRCGFSSTDSSLCSLALETGFSWFFCVSSYTRDPQKMGEKKHQAFMFVPKN